MYQNPVRGGPGLGRGEALWRGTPVCHHPPSLAPLGASDFSPVPAHSVVPNGTIIVIVLVCRGAQCNVG